MGNVPAFKLETFDDGHIESLWLSFDPNLMEFRNRSGRYLRATKNLVETFFIIEQEYLFGENDEEVIQNEENVNYEVENDINNQNFIEIGDDDSDDSDDSDELPVKIIDDLYLQLRELHRQNGPLTNHTDEYIQHDDLRPTLTNYQIEGVKWMLSREQITDYFPTEFKQVFQRWPDNGINSTFFYNDRTMILMVNKNEDVPIPTGGILADAMGLGKTVEILDLILLNRRTWPEPVDTETDFDKDDDEMQESNSIGCDFFSSDDDNRDEPILRCWCPKKHLTDIVRCIRCRMYQHRSCVSQHNIWEAPDAKYICPTCWQNEVPFPAKTTFIVSPPSIKLQWRDEVIKHINNFGFKVSVLSSQKIICKLKKLILILITF